MPVDVVRHIVVPSEEAKQSFCQVRVIECFQADAVAAALPEAPPWGEKVLTCCPGGVPVAECFSRN